MSKPIKQRYLKMTDASTYVGLSTDTLWKLIKAKKLTAYKVTRCVTLDIKELEALHRRSASN